MNFKNEEPYYILGKIYNQDNLFLNNIIAKFNLGLVE